jgi:hypothetical protein
MSSSRTLSSDTASSNPAFIRSFSGARIDVARPRAREATMDWFAVADRIGQHVDLDATAYTNGAMVRRRGVPSATNLLCLALLYGPGRMPLRLIAERSAALGIAQVSEPALLRRLLNAAPWLEFLADAMIIDRLDDLAQDGDDATSLRNPDMMLSQASHERRQRQIAGAKSFFIDFSPWPDGLYTDDQIQWLMSTRWLFVTATIKDGPISRAEMDGKPTSALEHSRQMAHLVGALASP